MYPKQNGPPPKIWSVFDSVATNETQIHERHLSILTAWLDTHYICTTHIVMLTGNNFLWVNHTEPPQTACHLPCVLVSNVYNVQNQTVAARTLSISLIHTHAHIQLLVFLMPICLEDVCQCSIKIPSDERFKWLPLWVMRSCISEEALTAQHMKTDEKDRPPSPQAGTCLYHTITTESTAIYTASYMRRNFISYFTEEHL